MAITGNAFIHVRATRWEYRPLYRPPWQAPDDFLKLLNALGEEGWEWAGSMGDCVFLKRPRQHPPRPSGPSKFRLVIHNKGEDMGQRITVDDEAGTATVLSEDDHGDPVPFPAGTVVWFSSSNQTVLTAGAATITGHRAVASLTPLKATVDATGNALTTATTPASPTLSATVTDATGNPLVDSATGAAIANPSTVSVPIAVGAESQFVLQTSA